MKSRTIAVATSIAALAFASAPITAVAAAKSNHKPETQRVDRSRDASGVRHLDKSSFDKSSFDKSRDIRDR